MTQFPRDSKPRLRSSVSQHAPAGREDRRPPRIHVMLQGVENVVVRVVPGLKGIVIKPGRGAGPITVTPTRAGMRIGGRPTSETVQADADHPVGVAIPWLRSNVPVRTVVFDGPAPVFTRRR